MIPNDKIIEVQQRAKTDIVTVIGSMVELKPKGKNHWGICPFHHEKTPSLCVTQSKGLFKCFGCGKSGGAVNFTMEFKRITFIEAIKTIANIFNILL